jgi:hypothetical protein
MDYEDIFDCEDIYEGIFDVPFDPEPTSLPPSAAWVYAEPSDLFDAPESDDAEADDSVSIWFGPGPAPAGWTPAPPGCNISNYLDYFPDAHD